MMTIVSIVLSLVCIISGYVLMKKNNLKALIHLIETYDKLVEAKASQITIIDSKKRELSRKLSIAKNILRFLFNLT